MRRKSVAFRREATFASAPQLKRELEELLDGAELPKKLNIIRAFSYYSHLLNITEDVEELRRQRAAGREGAAPAHGSIAAALARLEAAGVQPDEVRAWLGAMTISPVLTAHPTEVQRKSIQDCEREVSRLLQVRSFAAIEIGAPSAALVEAAAGAGAGTGAGGVVSSSSAVSLASMALAAESGATGAGTGTSAGTQAPPLAPLPAPTPTVLCALTGEELADVEARLFRHMITLWQTAMLRLTKLKVTDEVNNAIEFHANTFLVVVPRLYASLEQRLARMATAAPAAAALPMNGAAASSGCAVSQCTLASMPPSRRRSVASPR